MEELTIDDKKYVSTKRAAKETGYAKDYVGQLCREGRVPARLVGRSWYVLESAIQDHRFGAPHEADNAPVRAAEDTSTLPPTWEAPKYEADSGTNIPSISRINRLHDGASESPAIESEVEPTSLRDAWQEWFSIQQPSQTPVAEQQEVLPEPEPEVTTPAEEIAPQQEEAPEEEAAGEVEIPIHTFYEPQIAALRPRVEVRETLPAEQGIVEAAQRPPLVRKQRRASSSVFAKVLVGVGVVCAVFSVAAAVISSGYADHFVISFTQASQITGVSVYQK